MKRLIALALAACLAAPVLAQQPTPEQQIAQLQAELQATREQLANANAQTARVTAEARTLIAGLQKELDTRKAAEKPAGPTKNK